MAKSLGCQESIRRFIEEQDRLRRLADPFGELHRPAADAFRQLGIGSAAIDFLRQEEEQRRLLAGLTTFDFGGIAKLAAEFDQQRKALEGPIEEARRIGLLDPNSEFRQSFSAAMEAREAYDRLFRSPDVSEMERSGTRGIRREPARPDYLGAPDALRAAMDRVRSPWLNIEEEERSARAFADIVGIGRGISAAPPYDAALVEALRPSLGDSADVATPARELDRRSRLAHRSLSRAGRRPVAHRLHGTRLRGELACGRARRACNRARGR